MHRHKVDISKNEPRFMPLIIFHLNCALLLMMNMNRKQIIFHSCKIRTEDRVPLKYSCKVYMYIGMFLHIYHKINKRKHVHNSVLSQRLIDLSKFVYRNIFIRKLQRNNKIMH